MFITAVCVLVLIKLRCPKNKSLQNLQSSRRSGGQGTRKLRGPAKIALPVVTEATATHKKKESFEGE